jgi:hypothetical protein
MKQLSTRAKVVSRHSRGARRNRFGGSIMVEPEDKYAGI